MPIDNYLVDEIAVTPFLNDDNVDQAPQYGPRVVHKARIEEVMREVRRSTGTVVTLETAVATKAAVTARDRVWIAPFVSNDAPRTFPVGFVFVDADGRSPEGVTNARKVGGLDGHVEFFL